MSDEDIDATNGEGAGAGTGETDEVPAGTRDRIASDPYCDHLGVDLLELSSGRAVTALTVTDDLVNFHGTPHGGAVYSLADAAFAAASNSHGESAFALETNISYLDAADVGDRLIATAEETHLTRRTGEYEVVVETDERERVATFRGRVYRP
jgi:acyl-CoA thioesterase